jgi:hypothetical protein
MTIQFHQKSFAGDIECEKLRASGADHRLRRRPKLYAGFAINA